MSHSIVDKFDFVCFFPQNSNLSDYDLNSPDILCSPTNFSDIYFEGNRNLSLVADLSGNVGEPDSSDNSNEGSMQVCIDFNSRAILLLLWVYKSLELINLKFRITGLDVQFIIIKICTLDKYNTNTTLFAAQFCLSTVLGESESTWKIG